jgi:hypothetical protein
MIVLLNVPKINLMCAIETQSAVGTVNIVAADFNPPKMRQKD